MSKTNLKTENDTDHFNDRVPQALRDHMLLLATAAKDDFISDAQGGESFGVSNITPIYGYHVSGFIPSQLGGFEVRDIYRSDMDSSYHLTKAQSEAMSESEAYMYECFYRDCISGLDKRAGDPKVDAKTFSYSDLDAYPDLQNDFQEYENEWFEPALLRLEMWIDGVEPQIIGNDRQQPERVFVRCGLNYRDQPYYRPASDETLFEFNVPVAVFLSVTPDAFVKLLEKKLERFSFYAKNGAGDL